jgi:hypothetical protein
VIGAIEHVDAIVRHLSPYSPDFNSASISQHRCFDLEGKRQVGIRSKQRAVAISGLSSGEHAPGDVRPDDGPLDSSQPQSLATGCHCVPQRGVATLKNDC